MDHLARMQSLPEGQNQLIEYFDAFWFFVCLFKLHWNEENFLFFAFQALLSRRVFVTFHGD